MTAEEENRIERGDDWQAEGLSILSNVPSLEVTDCGCWTNDFDDNLLGSFELKFTNVTVGVNQRDAVLNQREVLMRAVAAYDEWLVENKQPAALKRAS